MIAIPLLRPEMLGVFMLRTSDPFREFYAFSDWCLRARGVLIRLKAIWKAEHYKVRQFRIYKFS